jgi:hypothetical protein
LVLFKMAPCRPLIDWMPLTGKETLLDFWDPRVALDTRWGCMDGYILTCVWRAVKAWASHAQTLFDNHY